jgi:hypothetical protein
VARPNKKQALHALNNLCRLYKIPYDFGQVGKVRAYIMDAGITTNNKPNTQLCDCEQLYIGCGITGGNCKTRGLTKCA